MGVCGIGSLSIQTLDIGFQIEQPSNSESQQIFFTQQVPPDDQQIADEMDPKSKKIVAIKQVESLWKSSNQSQQQNNNAHLGNNNQFQPIEEVSKSQLIQTEIGTDRQVNQGLFPSNLMLESKISKSSPTTQEKTIQGSMIDSNCGTVQRKINQQSKTL